MCGAYVAFRVRGEHPGWVYGSENFITLNVNLGVGMLIRLGVYGVSLVLVWAVVSLMPRTSTSLGVRSVNMLYVYLWHGVFIRLAVGWGCFSYLKGVDPAIVYPFYGALALGAFVLLSSNFVRIYTDRIMLLKRSR